MISRGLQPESSQPRNYYTGRCRHNAGDAADIAHTRKITHSDHRTGAREVAGWLHPHWRLIITASKKFDIGSSQFPINLSYTSAAS